MGTQPTALPLSFPSLYPFPRFPPPPTQRGRRGNQWCQFLFLLFIQRLYPLLPQEGMRKILKKAAIFGVTSLLFSLFPFPYPCPSHPCFLPNGRIKSGAIARYTFPPPPLPLFSPPFFLFFIFRKRREDGRINLFFFPLPPSFFLLAPLFMSTHQCTPKYPCFCSPSSFFSPPPPLIPLAR